MRGHFLVVLTMIISNFALAEDVRPHGFTAEENKIMAETNKALAEFEKFEPSYFAELEEDKEFSLVGETPVRPWAEYEKAGYLIFSERFQFNSKEAKLGMAKNLPKDMDLVVFTGGPSKENGDRIRKKFEGVIESDRLKVVYMPGAGSGFWARDGVPVPVIRENDAYDEFLTLVDARYYHYFEADKEFGKLFNSPVTKHSYYFEGGNFIANSNNECLVVNKEATADIPDSIFEDHYGCQKLIRLAHVKGIGHADESVKFINDTTVLTDEKSYVNQLKKAGFDVVMLPRPKREYETYVNSLIVNGVVFVPVFGHGTDKDALKVYEDAGFETVIGLDSKTLSNSGMGSLHCITMTYPPVEMQELLKSMGGFLL